MISISIDIAPKGMHGRWLQAVNGLFNGVGIGGHVSIDRTGVGPTRSNSILTITGFTILLADGRFLNASPDVMPFPPHVPSSFL